ncbi:MAG: tRNA (N(6)-L-threonylcarbamoyladenosine(37)-C(2))-methylthiotransferase [Candidatus Nitrosocaldaceae archaeon]
MIYEDCLKMARVRIEYYGCSANVADAEMMAGILKEKGYEIVDNNEDINLLVTCTVKDATSNRMIDRIKKLSKKPLVVAGCFAKAEYKRVEKLNPNASIVSPDAIDRIDDVVSKTLKRDRVVILEGSNNKIDLPRIRVNPIISIVEIASGCLSECTFCETKNAKGWLRSYHPNDIIRSISKDVKQGCKEIWITSTDNGAYGRDLGFDLPSLLKMIDSIDGDFKVRVGMMNPIFMNSMIEELIEAFRSDKIFKFLHIPVQSGSDKILHLMKRNHKVELYFDIVKRFRREIRDISIATDIIVGFPNENEEDFNATLYLIKESKPDVVNISKYSARPNTEAIIMEQVDRKVINERSNILHRLVKSITLEENKRWIDWKGSILVDEIKDDGIQGRNFAYKPIFIRDKQPRLGEYIDVKVIKALPTSLLAEKI